MRDALVRGVFGRAHRLRPEVHPLAVEIAERQAKDIVADLESTARQGVVFVSGRPHRQREALERRLARIRELASEVEAAA